MPKTQLHVCAVDSCLRDEPGPPVAVARPQHFDKSPVESWVAHGSRSS